MRVQLRVGLTAGAVQVSGDHGPRRLTLHPVLASACDEQVLLLGKGERALHRLTVRALDGFAGLSLGHTPHHRDRLRRREGHIPTGTMRLAGTLHERCLRVRMEAGG